MRISLVQTDILWENKTQNLERLRSILEKMSKETDLVVLPEMFSTGFTMNSQALAETNKGETIRLLKEWSHNFHIALAGSFIAVEKDKYFNRAFFITPNGEAYYYDKRHLFRMGKEPSAFTAGQAPSPIIIYKGWNICLSVCYDLRFPVWLRNQGNKYDLLLVVASWPEARRYAWETLLAARAIENQCYVCGVNRIGNDGNGIHHSGQSVLLNARGDKLIEFNDNEENIYTFSIDIKELNNFREKFPAWKDADFFSITE